MNARTISGKVYVTVGRSEVRELRRIMPGGGLPNRDLTLKFTPRGTLLSMDPPGMKGPAVEKVIARARRLLRRRSR